MSVKPIGVIEPVGGHGGMDYYDYGLSLGLGNCGQPVRFYTCDETQVRYFNNVTTILSFKHLWKCSFLLKVIRYIFGHLKAFTDFKRHGGVIVHLHFFTFRSIDLIVLLLGKFWGFKIVVTVHDVSAFDKRANPFLERQCYALMDGIIVHNESSSNLMHCKNKLRCPLKIIPHGNYLPFVEPIIKDRDITKPFTLLFFGQIKEVKGLDLLIKSVAQLRDDGVNIRLIIAGRAWKDDVNEYIALLGNLNLADVVETQLRYITDEEVSSFYERADLVVLPYREIYQSGVLLLSMSYGKCVLCSDLLPFREVIEDNKNGFLFKSGDIESLVSKLKEIVCYAPQMLNDVQVTSLSLMKEKYDWNNIGSSTFEFYKDVISSALPNGNN